MVDLGLGAEAPETAPESQPEAQPEREGSYRVCEACGAYIPKDAHPCPECGADEDEDLAPLPIRQYDWMLFMVLSALLLAALLLLSRNREAARALEDQVNNKLRPIEEGGAPAPTPTPKAPPKPTATPLPLPTPTPKPPPTPTPIPFTPEMFGATPTPTSTPIPTPTPKRSKTLELRDQIAQEFRKTLNTEYPRAKVGDPVRLTTVDGRVFNGTVMAYGNQQVQVNLPEGPKYFMFRQLEPQSRLRVDPSERETWVEEKALEEVLKRLQNP